MGELETIKLSPANSILDDQYNFLACFHLNSQLFLVKLTTCKLQFLVNFYIVEYLFMKFGNHFRSSDVVQMIQMFRLRTLHRLKLTDSLKRRSSEFQMI